MFFNLKKEFGWRSEVGQTNIKEKLGWRSVVGEFKTNLVEFS